MGLIVLGNLVCALSAQLSTLLLGRTLLGLGSMFSPLAAGLAVTTVAPERRGKALSFVFLGISLSYVIGVPVGAWMGLNHGWHSALWLMSGASIVALAALLFFVPAQVQAPGAQFAGIAQVLRNGTAVRVLLTTLAYFSAIFSVFTYLGPVLTALVPMSSTQLSLTVALFGLSGVAGTLIGGAANDRLGSRRTQLVMLPMLMLMMLLLPLTAGYGAGMLAVLLAWGTAGFSLMAPQQSRLIAAVPAQAPLALSLNTSMLYLGAALGAAAGGAALNITGFARLSWVGAPFAFVGVLLVLTSRPDRPISKPTSATAS